MPTMDKKILLIGNDRTEDDTRQYHEDYASFFKRSFSRVNTPVNISWTLLQDLYIEVGDGDFRIVDTKDGNDIRQYDLILLRGKGFREQFDVIKAVSEYAKTADVPIINDYSAFRDSSKLGQAVTFFTAGLPMAKSVYVNRSILENGYEVGIEFPCVMKAVFGAHGNDNYLVNSLEEVRRIAQASALRFVLQRMIPNDGDYRILVAGDNILGIERKAVEGSHLNNTSQGGSARLVSQDVLPEGMIADARRIARHLDMTIAGVDALIDKHTGEYYFLEVNSQPQLMSGAYVDQKEQLIGASLSALLQ